MTQKKKYIEPEMVNLIHKRVTHSISLVMIEIPRNNKLDYKFEIGKYPVTFDEYDAFCEDKGYTKPSDNGWGRGKRPVINISWDEANSFCEWVSKKTKLMFRLPNEKEWEYACRAGTETKWSFGDDEKELDKYAWYYANSNGTTHLVGEKLPNSWGLYDMHGNVWEWCEDWYDKEEKEKVLRGGSWGDVAVITRSADRDRSNPSYRLNVVGFRLLRTLP